MEYQKYLFISTNLKARTVRFIQPSAFLWLKDAEWLEIEDWLRDTPYNFLLEREDWDRALWENLNKEIMDIKRSVNDEIFESILLWDFYFHNLRSLIHQTNKEVDKWVFYPIAFSKRFKQESKLLYQKAIKIWEETNNAFEVDLFLDIENILLSEKFIKYLCNKNIYSFFIFRNNLLLIKILYRAKNLGKNWEEINKMGIYRIKYGINFKDLYMSQYEQWLDFFGAEYKDFMRDLLENKEDIDFLIKIYIYKFLKKNFSKIVSGPEVILYYFYNKYIEGEELISILKLKKNKIPNSLWEKRLLKINV